MVASQSKLKCGATKASAVLSVKKIILMMMQIKAPSDRNIFFDYL
jgi:hypothetical protein